MPELPEVETVCRGLRGTLIGNIFRRVEQRRPNLRIPFPKDFVQQIQGQQVVDLRRRAKYIQVFLNNSQVLIIHLGMSGKILIEQKNNKGRADKHDHVVFTMSSGHTIRYRDPRRFGLMALCSVNDLDQHRLFVHIGPEPLADDFNANLLASALTNRKMPIKSALLDQTVVAGLGNIYVCEALFRSRISPLKPTNTCSLTEMKKLVPEIKQVLQEAIAAGGSTLRDHVQPSGEMGYFQHTFKVYGREKEPCSRCSAPIQRIVQSGRSTFYCPECQR